MHFIETLFDCPSGGDLNRIPDLPAKPLERGTFQLALGFMKREQLLHVLNDMRCFGTLAFAVAGLGLPGPGPALAFRTPRQQRRLAHRASEAAALSPKPSPSPMP